MAHVETLHSPVGSYDEGRTEVNSKSPGNEPQCLLINHSSRRLGNYLVGSGVISKLPSHGEN